MGTLQELIRYCSEESHLGALLLTGEWGCGKTYLIEKELAEALPESLRQWIDSGIWDEDAVARDISAPLESAGR